MDRILDEVKDNRQNIRSDNYSMSIGEIINLYEDEEIVIKPAFQRIFRWSIDKQSRLIESLLIGIPLPPIFVSQQQNGVWEVVDGLQRLSTILQFFGTLKDSENDKIKKPSKLVATRYLPSLEGMTREKLPKQLQLQLKRTRLDVQILLKESSGQTKYDLFDRLNSGGVATSAQEVRTALLLMENKTASEKIECLRNNPDVIDLLPVTPKQKDEQFDISLLVRFIVLQNSSSEELKSFNDIESFLTEKLLTIAGDEVEFDKSHDLVEKVCRVANILGPEIFRGYIFEKEKFSGRFYIGAFEAVTSGLAGNIDSWIDLLESHNEDYVAELLLNCVKDLWSDPQFKNANKGGIRATTRAPQTTKVGKRIFSLQGK